MKIHLHLVSKGNFRLSPYLEGLQHVLGWLLSVCCLSVCAAHRAHTELSVCAKRSAHTDSERAHIGERAHFVTAQDTISSRQPFSEAVTVLCRVFFCFL